MKLWGIGLVLALLGLVLPASAQEKGVTVIYVGGWDCGPCIAWKNKEKQDFVKSPQYQKVTYVEIDAPKLREVYQEKYWPEKYRPVLAATPNKAGTPRFIVIKDGQVLFNERGNYPWARAWAKIQEVTS